MSFHLKLQNLSVTLSEDLPCTKPINGVARMFSLYGLGSPLVSDTLCLTLYLVLKMGKKKYKVSLMSTHKIMARWWDKPKEEVLHQQDRLKLHSYNKILNVQCRPFLKRKAQNKVLMKYTEEYETKRVQSEQMCSRIWKRSWPLFSYK